MESKKIYCTLDNGGRPFKVIILNGVVNVHKMKYYSQKLGKEFYNKSPLFTFYPKLIFIGRSPCIYVTRFSGGIGPEFDGNSILLYIDKNQYIFIGARIYSFCTMNNNQIVKYYLLTKGMPKIVGSFGIPFVKR